MNFPRIVILGACYIVNDEVTHHVIGMLVNRGTIVSLLSACLSSFYYCYLMLQVWVIPAQANRRPLYLLSSIVLFLSFKFISLLIAFKYLFTDSMHMWYILSSSTLIISMKFITLNFTCRKYLPSLLSFTKLCCHLQQHQFLFLQLLRPWYHIFAILYWFSIDTHFLFFSSYA